MNLTKVLAGVEGLKAKGSLDIDINNITQDTNTLEKGDLFIAVKGLSTDGHKYIPQAIAKGAAAIMIDEGVAKEIIPLIADRMLL